MSQPQPLSKIGKQFLNSLGRGALVGMTLRLYKSQIKKIVGTKDFARYIAGQTITDDNKLLIYCSNDQWRAELQARRYQIRQQINRRIDKDFITEVIIK
jgi:predicted nucleic acid-binding Zn ribbon protein